MSVYALLVGIDAYRATADPLKGAVRDVRSALEHLTARVPAGRLKPLLLCDKDATRAAVIEGFRAHLSKAGPGDSALFWFSGHGSQMPVPAPFAATEPDGFAQTLVCVDSRHGRTPDLLDKEVGILISEIAARGAHVVAVLDCCHSDGGSRRPVLLAPGAALRARYARRAETMPPAELLLPELAKLVKSGDGRSRGADHVSLAACQSIEVAYEIAAECGFRGLFSLMLLRYLTQPGLTYRDILVRTRALVESEVPGQHPAHHPRTGSLLDQPFLGGHTLQALTRMTMRHVHGAWQVDAGACHGIVAGSARDPMLLGVYDDPQRRQVRVVEVLPDRCVVEPMGWQPDDANRQYPVAITRVPLPRAVVEVAARPSGTVGSADQDARARAASMIAQAVRRSGPGGIPSPHIQLAAPEDPYVNAELRLAYPAPGTAVICGADGSALDSAQPCAQPDQAVDLVRRIEHIARWRGVLRLENPSSRLAGAVSIEVIKAAPGERLAFATRAPCVPEEDGAIHLAYRREAGQWVPPDIFIRLRNNTRQHLYCVLLDLTDRFRMHSLLFPGAWVAPGVAQVDGGRRVTMTLPPGRVPDPGTHGTDWLKVMVAECGIDSALFELPRLGEPTSRHARTGAGLGGIIDRLMFDVLRRDRDISPAAPRPLEWTTSTVTVFTSVPS